MAMSLKELAHCVHETLDANKDKWGMIAVETQYLITYELAEKLFAWAGEIDESEIGNLNNSFWEAGIQPRDFDEIARAIAIILEARCVTQDEREQKHVWLENLCNNVAENIVKRINRRQPPSEKKREKEWRFGEFSKFDFIKTYGYMYDSEDEANEDANNPDATCPLLMGLLNSGWLNISAIEDKSTGKITVSVRDENFMFSSFTMLTQVKIAFETLLVRREYQARRNAVRAGIIWFSLRRRLNLRELNGMTHASVDCKPNELYAALEHILTDGSIYPQNVFDFKTANTDFLKMVKNAVCIIANLDETQHDVARRLFVNLLDGMKQMSEIESRLVKEQQERDPLTNRFIHPKYDISNNIYTLTIGTVIDMLEWQYNIVNRMDLAAMEEWRNMPENKGMWHPISSWEEEKSISTYIKAQYYAAGEKPPMVRHSEMKWHGNRWIQQVTEVPEFSC